MTDYKVALNFEDGETRFITVADDQSIADAAYRQRINIPVDCNDGACGTCKARWESGDYDAGDYVEDALSDAEAAEGFLLACQARPRSNMVVGINSTSAIAKTQARTYRATITEITKHSPKVIRFRMSIPNREELAYLPGQYVNLKVPGSDDTRSLSFANDPETDELEFLVKIVPDGLLSTWLAERARVGDEVEFTGPNGSFFLREAHRPVLMVAGGTGLAPMLAMLRTLRRSGSDRTVHLVYGATEDLDVCELDTLEGLASDLKNFTWDYVVSDPNTKAKNQGFVMPYITADHLHGGDTAVYLCGPPPMVEAVRSYFKDDLAVEPNGFFYEKFTPNATSAEKPGAPVEELATEERRTTPERPPAATAPPVRVETSSRDDSGATPAPASRPAATGRLLEAGAEARGLLGTVQFLSRDLDPVMEAATAPEPVENRRSMLGVERFEARATGEATPLDADRALAEEQGSRTLLGVEQFPAREMESVGGAAPAGIAATHVPGDAPEDGYEIGEEHPSVHQSDSVFEARLALELGALEMVIGRLDSSQIAGYRILANSTLPHIEGDRFVDPSGFIESNAAFHDYLFTLTGNDHLRQAYVRLGVKNAMEEALEHATWCHPLVGQDHLDIVDALEAGDRERARALFIAHAERSKITTRRAYAEAQDRPRFITPGRFSGKVVLVTGAAQGIGEAVAKRISAEGGALVLADRSELLLELGDKLTAAGGRVVTQLADLETYAGAQSVVDRALDAFGRVDVAIHVVGGTIWRQPFEHYAEDQIVAEINRSLYPTLWGARAVLPHMYEQGHGTIVNVSSTATMGLNRLPYAAAKGGVNALTRSLAFEAAEHGVRVVATAPGGTEAPPRRIPRGGEPETAEQEAWHQVTVDQTVDSSLLKRYGTLDEQAAAICFVASDEGSYLTGQILPVAGGDLG